MEPIFDPWREKKRSSVPITGLLVLLILAGIGYLLWYGGSWFEGRSWESKYSDLKMERLALEIERDDLQDDYAGMTEWYAGIRDSINSRLGDGRDGMLFVTPDDEAVAAEVLGITGGFSEDVSEQWADFKRMYDWVVDNIEYSSDTPVPVLPGLEGRLSWQDDFWRMPSETIEDGVGDCEDMAVLLASMMKSYSSSKGYPLWVITFDWVLHGHAAVAFPVEGGKLTILDPAGHYYTGEPQSLQSSTVSDAVQDWLDYWSAECPSAYVDSVFSDSMLEMFSTTNEFVQWASS